jgi:hypothetical protein
MIIKLTPAEIQMAALVGSQRVIESIKWGAKHRFGGHNKDTWQMNIEGACGECALAKYLNVFWSKGSHGALDVDKYNVRTTHHENGCLILHEDDADDVITYLVVGLHGEYRIAGYISGKDGKQAEYWKDPQNTQRWAYFIPQNKLHYDYKE